MILKVIIERELMLQLIEIYYIQNVVLLNSDRQWLGSRGKSLAIGPCLGNHH